jgi:general stress protein 26
MTQADIIVENGDSVIWHRDHVVQNLILLMSTQHPFVISLNHEGPCALSLGLYDLLDQLCDKFNFSKQHITLLTCNQIENHDQYMVKRLAPMKGVIELQAQYSKARPCKNIDKHTKHFANFVGRGNRMRLAIASHLHLNHRDKTLQSYHTDIRNAYFFHHIGLEEMMFHNYDRDHIAQAFDFLNQAPIMLDKIRSYPILHEKSSYRVLDYYDGVFVDIINMAYFSGNTFYIDEKIWRPVVTKTPFIVQGPSNFLKNLKKLGFKTFDSWWDEGYSEDPPDYQVLEIIKVIDTIAQWDHVKLVSIYEQMQPILEHNYQTFMNLTAADFKRAFSYV